MAASRFTLSSPLSTNPPTLLLENCGTSNELLACIEFCYGIFVCCCTHSGTSLGNRPSRQSLACIEFHWFMFHMRDESERAQGAEGIRERERERVPQLTHGLWESETLEDSGARLRSGDNAVITSFEYFTLSHCRTSVSCLHAKKDMPLPHCLCHCHSHCLWSVLCWCHCCCRCCSSSPTQSLSLQHKYAREMINFWLKAQRWAPVFGMSLIGNSKRKNELYEQCVYPVNEDKWACTVY